ncbi:SLC13 family permease [Mycolicibacterium llatzerense]|nr:SLC13 family permease [Mycolicibacterium llatzerense]
MTHQMWIVVGILAGAVGLFVWGRPRADIVGVLVVVALMSSGVLTPTEALAGFGSPVVILLAGIFIVSAGLVNTGITQRLGEFVVKVGGRSEARLVALVMVLAAGIGSVMNSAAIVSMLIPVVLTVTAATGLNRKRMLMPLCVAVMISGMMTSIASSPNIIIESILSQRGIAPPLGFFGFTPFGVVTLVVSVVFMLVVGRNLLSRKRTGDADAQETSTFDVIESYGLKARWHLLHVSADSSLVGQSVAAQRQPLRDRYGLDLLGFEKHGRGAARYLSARPETVFEAGDLVFTLVDEQQTAALSADLRCQVTGPRAEDERREVLQDVGVAEVMLAPESKSIGTTLGDLDLAAAHNVTVLAVRHRGQCITEDLPSRTLDFGDAMLVGGNWDDIERLSDTRRNFILLNLPAEYQQRLVAPGRARAAVAILIAMVACMAFGWLPGADAALLGALAMVGARCVRVDSIYRLISWNALVLIAGMLPLATALAKTGTTTLIAHHLVETLGALGPTGMLAVVFLVTAVVALFISNSATAVLIAPVAIEAAQALHVSPQGFAMTVAIACSAAFVTPVSSPTNMLVMEPGGYRFSDYAKVGVPLLALTMVITVVMARLIYLPG